MKGHGVPIGLAVAGANCHDMKLVRKTIENIVVERPEPAEEHPQDVCLDKGYDYQEVRDTLREFGFTAHIRAWGKRRRRSPKKRASGLGGGSWERIHSWLNRFRRILTRWEKKAENSIAFLHFACALIALRAAGLFG